MNDINEPPRPNFDLVRVLASVRSGNRTIEVRHLRFSTSGRDFVQISEMRDEGREYSVRIAAGSALDAVRDALSQFAEECTP